MDNLWIIIHNYVLKMDSIITLTKKIAKHGNHNIIVIPQFLKGKLKHNDIVELKIRVLK